MMTLVIGPNGSGKSVTAERLVAQLRDELQPQGSLIYLATMVPADEDGRSRVAAHQRSRAGAGFVTIESPLADLETRHPRFVEPTDVVLLEDVSNLLANLIFTARDDAATTTALKRIRYLREASCHLVAVTIGDLVPEPDYDSDTLAYLASLNLLNAALAAEADQVITMPEKNGR